MRCWQVLKHTDTPSAAQKVAPNVAVYRDRGAPAITTSMVIGFCKRGLTLKLGDGYQNFILGYTSRILIQPVKDSYTACEGCEVRIFEKKKWCPVLTIKKSQKSHLIPSFYPEFWMFGATQCFCWPFCKWTLVGFHGFWDPPTRFGTATFVGGATWTDQWDLVRFTYMDPIKIKHSRR